MKYWSLGVFCVLIIYFTSCKRDNSDDSNLFTAIKDEYVILPDSILLYKNDYKSLTKVATQNIGNNKKMLIWVDSTKCSLCQLDYLYNYEFVNDYIKESLYNLIEIMIVITPKSSELNQLLIEIPNYCFDYPISVDYNQEMYRNFSKFIDKDAISIILFDENNKIISGIYNYPQYVDVCLISCMKLLNDFVQIQ